ncbi:MAG: hypothetical protein KGS61_00405 [Verrucomicrobia bacterium]|nr:hypothetical protein [Verrucomicrobiota bacterium]
MNKTSIRISTALGIAAAGLLGVSLWLPLWHMKMEAPQYQGNEALRVRIYPHAMRGDLHEIRVLNQYVGVTIPDSLPQFHWLPTALGVAAVFSAFAGLLPVTVRRRSLVGTAVLLSLALVIAAGQAQWQMYDVGHHRNPHAPLQGVQNFTPPILGKVKVANFEIETGLGAGTGLIGAAIALQLTTAFVLRERSSATCRVCGHPFGAAHPANPAELPA